MSSRKQYGMKLSVELVGRVDAALAPGQSRTTFVEEALEAALGGGPPATVHQLRPPKPVRLDTARRVKTSAEAKAGLVPVDWRDKNGAA